MKWYETYCRIASKIAALWLGIATEEEKREVEAWKNERVGRSELVENLLGQKDMVENDKELKRFPVWEAWRQAEKRLGRPRKGLRLLVECCKYAAVLAILAGGGYFLFRERPLEVKVTKVGMPVFHSGTKGARLILGDGKVVEITKDNRFQLAETDGTIIRKDSAGIVYSPVTSAGDSLVYNKMETLTGMEYTLALSDGSLVYLNAETSVKYPVVFAGNTRRVELEGEAYFEVTKDPAHPFIVVAGGVEVEVYGTSFNVNTFVARGVETVLVEGSVGVRSVQTGKEQRLQPDRMAVWDEQAGEFEVREVDARRYAEWKSGIFRFSNERLEDILTDLANWYDVSVIYRDDAAKELHFSGYMQRYDNIKTILDAMTEATGVRFAIQGRDIIVQGK